MPGCVMRVLGTNFDVDGYLSTSPFKPCAVFHRGVPRRPGSTQLMELSGFHVLVSDFRGDRVEDQIREAAAFVESSRAELERMVAWPGVEFLMFDFGCELEYRYAIPPAGLSFPPVFARACGTLGFTLELTFYPRRPFHDGNPLRRRSSRPIRRRMKHRQSYKHRSRYRNRRPWKRVAR